MADFVALLRKGAPFVVAFALFLGFSAAGLHQVSKLRAQQAAAARPAAALYTVRTATPSSGEVIQTIPALATVKSAAGIRLQAEIAGRLTSLKCREGDRVTAGQELATLDARESTSQMQAAAAQSRAAANQSQAMASSLDALKSRLEAARTNSEYWAAEETRAGNLYLAGALSRSQRDAALNRSAEARGTLLSLQAQIESARSQRSALHSQQQAAQETTALWRVRAGYATLTAPVSGVIAARFQEEGQFVPVGAPIYLIEDDRQTRLMMQVPQDKAGQVATGLEVLVDLPSESSARSATFHVTRVYPGLNELRQLGVEATSDVPVPGIPYDMQIPARIITNRQSGMVLSPDLLFPDMNRPGEYFVYEIRQNQAARLSIRPLLIGDTGAAIVPPGAVSSGTLLMSGTYLDHLRLPASFPVEVAQ